MYSKLAFLLLGALLWGVQPLPRPTFFTTSVILGSCHVGVYDQSQVCFADPGGSGGVSGQAYYNLVFNATTGFLPGMYSVQTCVRVVTSTPSLYPATYVFAFPPPPPGASALPSMAAGPVVLANMTSFQETLLSEGVLNLHRVAPPIPYLPADSAPFCTTSRVYLSALSLAGWAVVPVQVQWMEYSAYSGVTAVIHMFSATPL